MFEKLATGTTTFSIDIRRSCKTCYNIRLLKVILDCLSSYLIDNIEIMPDVLNPFCLFYNYL